MSHIYNYEVKKNRTAASIFIGSPSSISASRLHSESMTSYSSSANGSAAMPSIAFLSSAGVR